MPKKTLLVKYQTRTKDGKTHTKIANLEVLLGEGEEIVAFTFPKVCS